MNCAVGGWGVAMSCGVGWQLQLRFDPLAWEIPYASGLALKKEKEKTKKSCTHELFISYLLSPPISSLLTSQPKQQPVYFVCPQMCLFWILHIDGITEYVVFHLAYNFQVLSMLQNVSILYSILWSNYISLSSYTIFYLPVN